MWDLQSYETTAIQIPSHPLQQTKDTILTERQEDGVNGHVVDAEEGCRNDVCPDSDNLIKQIQTNS